MNISRNNVNNMYFEVRLELFEACIIPKSNFQIRIYGIRKMTRISIKNTILRIVAQVVVFDRGGGGGGGLVPYTMITNLFCTHTPSHLQKHACTHACTHAHTHMCRCRHTSRSRASWHGSTVSFKLSWTKTKPSTKATFFIVFIHSLPCGGLRWA